MTHFHAVVWIDHRLASIYAFGAGDTSRERIESHAPRHIHHRAGTAGSGHAHDKPAYFREIAAHLAGAGAILIVGPAEAKTEFKTFLEAHAPALAAKVAGVEAMGDESAGEIVAFARKFFLRRDRMTPQR